MQQPLIPPGADRSRYDYSIQPTEDHEEFHEDVAGGKKPAVTRRPGKAPNYKPKPLTWPFIVGMVVMLCVAIGLVAFADRALPDSDSDALIVDSLPTEPPKLRFFARAGATNISAVASPSPSPSQVVIASVTGTVSSETVQSITGAKESVGSADRVSILDVSSTDSASVQRTSVSEKQSPTSTVTRIPSISGSVDNDSTSVNTNGQANRRPNTTGQSSSDANQKNAPKVTSSSSTSVTYPSGVTPIGTSVIKTTLGSTTIPKSTVTKTTIFTTVKTVTSSFESTILTTFTTDMTTVITSSTPVTVFPTRSFGGNQTFSGSGEPSVGSPPPPPQTSFEHFTLTVTGPGEGTGTEVVTLPTTAEETFTVTSTSESTVMATVAPVVGEITVTIFSTAPVLLPTGPNNQEQHPQTELKTQGNVVVTGATVVGGETVTRVDKGTPVVVVVPTNQVETIVNGPSIKVFTTQVGGSEFTSTLILTPTVATPVITANIATTVGGTPVTFVTQPPPVTFETTINGVVQTVVETPAPQTVISQAGGALTTVGAVITAAAPGQPITFTVVTDIAGTPVTQVVVSTPAGGVSFQPITFSVTSSVGGTPTVVTITPDPTSFVTTIDGTPVTIVTTPPVTSFTTTAGGTLTTQTSVITPTGTGLITLTFITSSSGTLATLTSTISPTTFVTTHSGTLTTITSTPSPTTHLSTRSKSTSTFTSTSSFTSTLPPPSSSIPTPTPPPVIASTRVYKWTESDIFLGTFLPPLFGVALVIPLRIIDLNAKLYQPFQSLAQPGGSSGSETLLMQYTGFMTFITPVVTLLQGHPVPFLTTLMVLVGSFIVPLATEAIGLKLHGRCIRNTATPGCGPSLGVSPAPAHALIALIVAVIILLLIILFLISRWATGVNSNPWNIAGIASLAENSQVRIRQNSSAAMRRAISEKRYGLGYFTNPTMGREEYGIVLTDESSAALQPHESQDSDGLVGAGVTTKRANSANRLPLMPLRYPWRGAVIAGQLGLLIFIIYYHAYYHVTLNEKGRVFDDGRLWEFMNANYFGVRFVAAIVGVVIAFCWQSFFLSVSVMAPYQLMAQRTQPAERSILFSSCTNAFSGIYAAVKQRHLFLFATSLAAILSELLPVFLANVFFSLAQTSRTATACAAISSIILGLLIIVLVGSFFVKWPPMPVDPRSIAGTLYYVSQSHMLDNGDLDGVSELDGKEREMRVREKGRRYFYGVLVGGSWRRLGVDCDLGPGEGVDTAYHGVGSGGGVMSGGLAEGHDGRLDDGGGGGHADVSRDSRSASDEAPVLHEHDEGLLASGRNGYGSFSGPEPSTLRGGGHGTLFDTMPPSMMYGRDN